MNCEPPGSSVHGIFQVRIQVSVAMPSYRDTPDPGVELTSLVSPALASEFFTTLPLGRPKKAESVSNIFSEGKKFYGIEIIKSPTN